MTFHFSFALAPRLGSGCQPPLHIKSRFSYYCPLRESTLTRPNGASCFSCPFSSPFLFFSSFSFSLLFSFFSLSTRTHTHTPFCYDLPPFPHSPSPSYIYLPFDSYICYDLFSFFLESSSAHILFCLLPNFHYLFYYDIFSTLTHPLHHFIVQINPAMPRDTAHEPLLAQHNHHSSAPTISNVFTITVNDLAPLTDPTNPTLPRDLGGIDQICKALKVDPKLGLNSDEAFGASSSSSSSHGKPDQQKFVARSEAFGRNVSGNNRITYPC